MRSGELRIRQTREDTLLPGRTHERANQYYRGVRVFGGDVARQLRNGVTESAVRHDLRGDRHRSRRRRSTRIAHGRSSRSGPAQPIADRGRRSWWCCRSMPAGYALTWRVRVVTRRDARQYFVDARTGATLLDYSDRKDAERRRARRRRARRHQEDQRACQLAASSQATDDAAAASHPDLRHAGQPARADDFLTGRRRRCRLGDLAIRHRQRLDGRRRSATRTSTPG